MAEHRSGPRLTATIREVVSYVARYEELTINRHHLLRVLDERDRTGEKCPRLEWTFIPAGVFLTILFVFTTAEFHDTLGKDKATWEAFALQLLWASGLSAATVFLWWAFDRISHALWRPRKTSDQIIDEIIAVMGRNDAAFEERQSVRRARTTPDAQ